LVILLRGPRARGYQQIVHHTRPLFGQLRTHTPFPDIPGGGLSQRRNDFDAVDSGIDSILRKE
jgi:hypothetical protein